MTGSPPSAPLRTAELVGVLSLATDLGLRRDLGDGLASIQFSSATNSVRYYSQLLPDVIAAVVTPQYGEGTRDRRQMKHAASELISSIIRRLELPGDVSEYLKAPPVEEEAFGGTWDIALGAEPQPHLTFSDHQIDRALALLGDVVDLISPSLTGHSRGVATVIGASARLAGFSESDIRTLTRAASVHDIGRLAVDRAIWDKPGPLTPNQTVQVQRHPLETGRILSFSGFLSRLEPIASFHHEHLDGSGYHRGSRAPEIIPGARLLAVADIFHAMLEPRPHRHPLPRATAESLLREQVREGRLDELMVEAVIKGTLAPLEPPATPNGLTSDEISVAIAFVQGTDFDRLGADIGPRRAQAMLDSAMEKMDVRTRIGAALFVMEHELIH